MLIFGAKALHLGLNPRLDNVTGCSYPTVCFRLLSGVRREKQEKFGGYFMAGGGTKFGKRDLEVVPTLN